MRLKNHTVIVGQPHPPRCGPPSPISGKAGIRSLAQFVAETNGLYRPVGEGLAPPENEHHTPTHRQQSEEAATHINQTFPLHKHHLKTQKCLTEIGEAYFFTIQILIQTILINSREARYRRTSYLRYLRSFRWSCRTSSREPCTTRQSCL